MKKHGWKLTKKTAPVTRCPFCNRLVNGGEYYFKRVPPFRHECCAKCLPGIIRAAESLGDKTHWSIV